MPGLASLFFGISGPAPLTFFVRPKDKMSTSNPAGQGSDRTGRIRCPRCNQGWVYVVRVRGKGTILHVCEECEATWDGSPTKLGWRDFQQRMKELGCTPEWSQVEDVPETSRVEPSDCNEPRDDA
jgi:hypothetical protein